MMDVTVFEQAPQLQARHLEGVILEVDMTKSAVEVIDRPQLHVFPQQHKLHLLLRKQETGLNQTVRQQACNKAGAHLFALSVALSVRKSLQETFKVQSHVWSKVRWIITWLRKCTCSEMQSCESLYLRFSDCNTELMCCRCLPHRGVRALFPLQLGVTIWSSTNCPSKTWPSLKVNFPYEP